MGGFYGSTHVRTTDRAAVLAALEQVARKEGGKYFIGPEIDGWVTVYPPNGGQSDDTAKALARKLPHDILHVLVHDDDIFAYSFFRAGKLADEFNSLPDYFGAVSAKKRAKLRGRPEVFDHLVTDEAARRELRELLALGPDEQPAFASESLTLFARLLRLPNAVTSYDYLNEDETEGVERFEEFVHVPDRGPELAVKREAEDRERGQMQRLREQGLLLWERLSEPMAMPLLCPDRDGAGFLTATFSPASSGSTATDVVRLAPPWQQATPAGLTIAQPVTVLNVSPSGRYLAAGGQWQTRVLDLDRNAEVCAVPTVYAACWVGFAGDESYAVVRSPEEVVVASLADGRTLGEFATPRTAGGALHPSGLFVYSDHYRRLIAVELLSGAERHRAYAGGRQALGVAVRIFGQQSAERIPAAQVEARLAQDRAQRDQHLAVIRQNFPAEMSAEARAAFAERWRAHTERALAALRRDFEEQAAADTGAENVASLACSRDGRWLFCGTDQGLRVYTWDAFLTGAEPAPQFAAATRPVPVETKVGPMPVPGSISALAHDEANSWLLFGGLGGTINYLDLASGTTATLLDIPGRPALNALILSRDCTSIACLTRPGWQKNDHRLLLQIWNYAALRDAARAAK